PLTWRDLLRAHRIRCRLWAGLLTTVWFGCARPPVPDVLPATTARDVTHPVEALGVSYRCTFRVLRDSTRLLRWPPINHPAQAARCTAHAMLDALRAERRHTTPGPMIPAVQGRTTRSRAASVDPLRGRALTPAGGSASPLSRYRRLAARREHNRTYYYRTVG